MSITECPDLREGYVELGLFEYEQLNYNEAIILLKASLKIEEKSKTYINESFCWDSTIYDVLSICCFNMELKEESYDFVIKALDIDPNNKRLKENKKLIQKSMTI